MIRAEIYPIKIALAGAGGRMGQAIMGLIQESEKFELAAAIVRENGRAFEGNLAGKMGEKIVSNDPEMLGRGEVIVDFTEPEATMLNLEMAVKYERGMVIGTTGFSNDQEKKIQDAAMKIPIVYCANTSMGVAILRQITQQVAALLDENWDVEITETHHNQKIDAPSGTALMLGHGVAKARGGTLDKLRGDRQDGAAGARKKGEIGFAVRRGGDVAGEHTVSFFGTQERIEITHRANSRMIFAQGALKAAAFIKAQKSGLYDMDDVLKGTQS